MTIRVRNEKTWQREEKTEFVEYVGKGSVLENPYTNGCRRKLRDQIQEIFDGTNKWTAQNGREFSS